ncbi:MAG: hypothetical protein ACOCWY_03435 [Thermodesulfobacteriota bacterium]
MKEFEIFVKSLSDGLKAFAKGVETVAGQLDDFVQSQQTDEEEKKDKPEEETPVTPLEKKTGSKEPETVSPEPVAPKPSPYEEPEDTQTLSATETILQRILRARNGVDIETLVEETGYDRRKIYNIIYRLKKRNQVKNKSKGVYIKA